MPRSLASVLLRAGRCLSSALAQGQSGSPSSTGSASSAGIALETPLLRASLSTFRTQGVQQALGRKQDGDESQALLAAPELEARFTAILDQRRPELHGLTLRKAAASGAEPQRLLWSDRSASA